MRFIYKNEKEGMVGMVRKAIQVMFVVILVVTGIFTMDDGSVHAHRESGGGSIKGKSKVSNVDRSKYIDSKYQITPRFTKGTSYLDIVSTGGVGTKRTKGETVIVQPPDSAKGNLVFTYKKIAKHKGKDVDLEFEVIGWGSTYFKNDGKSNYFLFFEDAIEFAMEGYNYVGVRARYRYTGPRGTRGTLLPSKDFGSYMNVIDLDINQYMRFSPGRFEDINKMFVYYNDTWVDRWGIGEDIAIGARFYRNLDPDNALDVRRGSVLFLVDGNEFTFLWSRDWTKRNSDGYYPQKGQARDWTKLANPQRFLYTPDKPMATKPVKPEKRIRVGKKDVTSHTLSNLGDTINYRVYHTVPNDTKEFYYKSYVMEDKLHEVLTVDPKKVVVRDWEGKNRTSRFNVAFNKKTNLLTIKPKSGELNKARFYDNYYQIEIPAKLKTPQEVIGELKFTGNKKIENRAVAKIRSLEKTAQDYRSNKVTTTIQELPTDPRAKKVTVQKVWEKDHELDRPETVTINLYADKKKIDSVDLNEKNNWKHTFEKLPIYNDDWSRVQYTVSEDSVKDYKTEIVRVKNELLEASYKITNTWDYPPLVPPKLNKKVNNKNEHVAKLNEPFKFSVYAEVPTELRGYHTLTIEDTLDNRFTLLGADILVDGKKIGRPTIQGQKVTKTFDRYELEDYKGKKLEFLIEAKIKPNLKIQEIANKGTIQPNNETIVSSNPVYVTPHPVEVGFKKIQIFTEQASKGLPVKVDFNVREFNTSHLEDTFNVGIYRVEGSNRTKVKTDTVRVGDVDKTLETIIPSSVLKKDEKVNYEAVIEGYNKRYVVPIEGEGKINTDGYTSTEEDIEVVLEELEEDVTEYKYKKVIKTQREIHKDMEKFYEEFILPVERVGKQKSGYGVEVEREVQYKNDLGNTNDIKAGLFVDEDLFKVRGTSLVDSYIEYEREDGYEFKSMETSKTMEIKNTQRIEKYTYMLPEVFVEHKTGTIFSPEQVEAKDSRIKHAVRAGGNKLYIPIWIDELGKYGVEFRSLEPTGVNKIHFVVKDELDVYAFMYGHIGSETIKQDEILLTPVNYKGFGILPNGWTQEDVEWLLE